MDIDISKIGYTKNADFKTVLEDGICDAKNEGADGFEYKVGEINGYEIKVVVEPSSGAFETIDIDGVNGFGYCLAFEND